LYKEIKVLEFIVNSKGVTTDPKQLEGVKKLQKPTTKKEVQQTLGLFSYFRKFIIDYCKIAAPLQKLIHKDQKFEWKVEQETAFMNLKHALTNSPVLALFDPTRETILKTDASTYGLRASLFQIVNSIERPIAFISRALTATEKKYTTTQLELLAYLLELNETSKFNSWSHPSENFFRPSCTLLVTTINKTRT